MTMIAPPSQISTPIPMYRKAIQKSQVGSCVFTIGGHVHFNSYIESDKNTVYHIAIAS